MRFIGTIVCTAATLAVLASSAQAVTLYTAPAPSAVPAPGNHRLYCDINNVSTHNVNITVDVMDAFGASVQTSGQIQLPPGQGFAIPDFGETGWYCRFIVQGGKATVRALGIYDNGTNYNIALPAE